MSQTNPTDVQVTKYAETFVLYGCKTKAFKATFPGTKAKPENIHKQACVFHDLPKVCPRIEQLHKSINSEVDSESLYTIRMALNELDDAKERAKENNQLNVMVSSIMGKAKIAELLVDKVNAEIKPTYDFAEYAKSRSENFKSESDLSH